MAPSAPDKESTSHDVELIVAGKAPGALPDLPVNGFLDELSALVTALERTDLLVTGRRSIEWVIADLHRRNPGVVKLRGRSVEVGPPQTARVVPRFFKYAEAIQAGETPPELRRLDIEAFLALAKPVDDGTVRTTIRNRTKSIEIEPAMALNARAALAPRTVSVGSLNGKIEGVNIHAGARHLWLYPWVGPTRIQCIFPEDLIPKVGGLLGQWVRVDGAVIYPAGSKQPELIRANDITPLPPPEDAPSLSELQGSAPDIDDRHLVAMRDESEW